MEWIVAAAVLYLLWRIFFRKKNSRSLPAANLIARNERAPLPPAPAEPLLPKAENRLRKALRLPGWQAQRLDGAHFMIEYVREDGAFSRRRITTRRIAFNPDGRRLLVAFCHERGEQRNFRIDRIKCCIDSDGVVHDDAAAFLSENFGAWTSGKVAANTRYLPESSGVGENWDKSRDTIRPHALILTALALADGEVHEQERAIIAAHCLELARRRSCPADQNIDKLNRYLARLKPNYKGLMSAIETMQNYSLNESTILVETATRLIKADGVLDSAEMTFLKDLKDRLGVR